MKNIITGLFVFSTLWINSCTSKLIIPNEYNFLTKGYLVYASFGIINDTADDQERQENNNLFFIEKKDFLFLVGEIGEPIIRIRETATEPIFIIKIDAISLIKNDTSKLFSFCKLFPEIKKSKITVYEEKNEDNEVINRVEILCGSFLISEKGTNYPYKGNYPLDIEDWARDYYLKNDKTEYSLHLHSSYTPEITVQIARGFVLKGILPSLNYNN